MLVLSRKVGEKITIGDGITVTVSRLSGGRVTLAIEAPSHMRILRGELAPFNKEAAAEPASAAEKEKPALGPASKPPKGTSPLATALPPALARRSAMLAPRPVDSNQPTSR